MYLHNLVLVHYSLNKGVITLLFVGASWSFLTRLPIAEVAVQGALAHAGGKVSCRFIFGDCDLDGKLLFLGSVNLLCESVVQIKVD